MNGVYFDIEPKENGSNIVDKELLIGSVHKDIATMYDYVARIKSLDIENLKGFEIKIRLYDDKYQIGDDWGGWRNIEFKDGETIEDFLSNLEE
tara:strand:+ start:114 stop:392 length:279 start_codon:yes stop_codon:yes gene_type:complete